MALSEELPRFKACELLKALEKHLIEHYGSIPAAKMSLMYVRRAMELIGCSPEKPTVEEEKKLLIERKVVIE
ncbi:MAG: hypothetical protein QXH44_09255 [Pyrobaculum sp.]